MFIVEALDLFTRMVQRSGVQLQLGDATSIVMLSACGAVGAFDFGRKVHSFVQDGGGDFGESILVFNALVESILVKTSDGIGSLRTREFSTSSELPLSSATN
jgi:hypothetical protein